MHPGMNRYIYIYAHTQARTETNCTLMDSLCMPLNTTVTTTNDTAASAGNVTRSPMWGPRHSMIAFVLTGKMWIISGVKDLREKTLIDTKDFVHDVWNTGTSLPMRLSVPMCLYVCVCVCIYIYIYIYMLCLCACVLDAQSRQQSVLYFCQNWNDLVAVFLPHSLPPWLPHYSRTINAWL